MKIRRLKEYYGGYWSGRPQSKGRKKGYVVTIIHACPGFWAMVSKQSDPDRVIVNSLWENQVGQNFATIEEAAAWAEKWIDDSVEKSGGASA